MSEMMAGSVQDGREYRSPSPGARAAGTTPAVVNRLIKTRRLDVYRLPGCRPLIDVNQLRRLIAESRTPALFGVGEYR